MFTIDPIAELGGLTLTLRMERDGHGCAAPAAIFVHAGGGDFSFAPGARMMNGFQAHTLFGLLGWTALVRPRLDVTLCEASGEFSVLLIFSDPGGLQRAYLERLRPAIPLVA